MLKINCPECRREIELPEEKLGEVVTCDFCKNSFVAGSSPRGGAGNGVTGEPSSAEPLSDGKFREIEYNGTFYSLQVLRHLRKSLAVFVFLFMVQVCCNIAFFGSLFLTVNLAMICFYEALLIFIPLFVVYLKFLKAMLERGSLYGFSLALYWFVPFIFIISIAADANSALFILSFIAFIADIIFRLYFIGKAAAILDAAKTLPPGEKPFIRTIKRYSLILIPSFVILLFSVLFFGSVKKDARLCRNCGIWIDRDSICFLLVRLLSSSEYKQTVFSEILDPEHQCSHHAGKTFLSENHIFTLQSLGIENEFEKKMNYVIGHFRVSERKEYIRDFMKEYSNIRANSSLDRYLREKDSPDYVRRLISLDLTSEEEEKFLRFFVPSWTGDSDLKGVEYGMDRGDMGGRIEGSVFNE